MTGTAIHTPYDGSAKPFTIGLKPLDPLQWLETDRHLRTYLDEKKRLSLKQPEDVIVSEPGSEASQHEILALVATTVCDRFPAIYKREGQRIIVGDTGHAIDLDDPAFPPIHRAASLVQEDLVLMRKGPQGWYLAAASVCFPSAWNLQEKFCRPMHLIHAPVPGFSEGTRNAALIERMFDNLDPTQPVIRWNWSLYGDARLYHPVSDNNMKRRFGDGEEPRNINLRLERQTLRKLPVSGDLLFTIRIHIDPLEALENHPDGANLAMAIASQVDAFSSDQVSYKGLSDERERLLKRLSAVKGLPPG